MASNNGNDKGTSQTPDTIVCDSLADIKDEKKEAESGKKAGETSRNSKKSAKGYKICCLDGAKETHEVYQDILSCVTLEQYKKTEIIQTNIENYIKKDADIEKLIAESSKLLNDLCTKIVAANSELCTMTTCINDIVFSKSSKKKRSKEEKQNADEVTACLDEINSKTGSLKDKGENAVESVITIAGIQTFTNTAGLKDFATNLMTSVTTLKECAEANVASTATEIETFREELNNVVLELAEMQCEEASQGTTIEGLCEVIDFICNCDCDGECLDLCAEFDECCKDSDDKPEKNMQKIMKDQN